MKHLACALLLVMALFRPVSADDDVDKKAATVLLLEGIEHAREGDHLDALEKFRAAYATYASPKILVNIGTTLRRLGRRAEAADVYERYLRAKSDPRGRAEVEAALAELEKQVATLRIEVSEPGARILIDGKLVRSKQRPLVVRVDPGSHMIAAEKKGFVSAAKTFVGKAGQTQGIRLELARQAGQTEDVADAKDAQQPKHAAPVVPEPDDQPPPSPGRGLRVGGVVGVTLGVIASGVGVKFALEAQGLTDELSSHPGPWSAALDDKEDEQQSAKGKAMLFTGIGVAAILGGGALYLLGRRQGRAAEASEAQGYSLTPTVTGSGVALTFGASF